VLNHPASAVLCLVVVVMMVVLLLPQQLSCDTSHSLSTAPRSLLTKV
jgi:hypothetical protein